MILSLKKEEISIILDSLSELQQQIIDKSASGFDEIKKNIYNVTVKIFNLKEISSKIKEYAEEIMYDYEVNLK